MIAALPATCQNTSTIRTKSAKIARKTSFTTLTCNPVSDALQTSLSSSLIAVNPAQPTSTSTSLSRDARRAQAAGTIIRTKTYVNVQLISLFLLKNSASNATCQSTSTSTANSVHPALFTQFTTSTFTSAHSVHLKSHSSMDNAVFSANSAPSITALPFPANTAVLGAFIIQSQIFVNAKIVLFSLTEHSALSATILDTSITLTTSASFALTILFIVSLIRNACPVQNKILILTGNSAPLVQKDQFGTLPVGTARLARVE
jgi:hypothetical protein